MSRWAYMLTPTLMRIWQGFFLFHYILGSGENETRAVVYLLAPQIKWFSGLDENIYYVETLGGFLSRWWVRKYLNFLWDALESVERNGNVALVEGCRGTLLILLMIRSWAGSMKKGFCHGIYTIWNVSKEVKNIVMSVSVLYLRTYNSGPP